MDRAEYIELYDDPYMYDQWDIGRGHERSIFMLKNIKGPDVLELGCGGSGFTRILVEEGYNCTCVDINSKWIELGRQRLPAVDYQWGMIEDFITEKRFDSIVLMEVLEHVLNPVTALAKARSLLAPQGRVLVSVPLRGGPWDHTDNHLRQYDLEMLMDHALEAGGLSGRGWEEGQYVYAVLMAGD